MKCENPYVRGDLVVPCGQCDLCKQDLRRVWTHRLMIENRYHEKSTFLTLTYNDEHLPEGGTLVVDDYQRFLKRLRKAMSPIQLRYFIVGEYGENGERPHYHAALFGIGPDQVEVMRAAWTDPDTGDPIGFVYEGTLTLKSAQYVCGYITKRRTNAYDPATKRWLNGRFPEFSRMSLKPGIGAFVVPDIVDSLTTGAGAYVVEGYDGTPSSLTMEGNRYSLGRYLKNKIRLHYGGDLAEESPQFKKYKETMQELFKENGLEKATDYQKKQFIRELFKNKRERKRYLNRIYSTKGGSL